MRTTEDLSYSLFYFICFIFNGVIFTEVACSAGGKVDEIQRIWSEKLHRNDEKPGSSRAKARTVLFIKRKLATCSFFFAKLILDPQKLA
jgi:hypothetical protein